MDSELVRLYGSVRRASPATGAGACLTRARKLVQGQGQGQREKEYPFPPRIAHPTYMGLSNALDPCRWVDGETGLRRKISVSCPFLPFSSEGVTYQGVVYQLPARKGQERYLIGFCIKGYYTDVCLAPRIHSCIIKAMAEASILAYQESGVGPSARGRASAAPSTLCRSLDPLPLPRPSAAPSTPRPFAGKAPPQPQTQTQTD